MPPRLPPRAPRQTPEQAKGRALAAKGRENSLRTQARLLAAQAKRDQIVAKTKQQEVERLRKCVLDCAKAYARAKAQLTALKALPSVAAFAARAENMRKRAQLETAVVAAKRALDAARAALEKAMADASKAAESPAQQTISLVVVELERAKQDTKEETKAAVDAGVPPAQLPPPPSSDPATTKADAEVNEVAKEAEVVADQTTNVSESAAQESDAAAVDAGASPPGAPPPAPLETAPPPALVEDAAKKAQDAVNEAVGAKPGSILPMLAVAGVVGYLFLRKD